MDTRERLAWLERDNAILRHKLFHRASKRVKAAQAALDRTVARYGKKAIYQLTDKCFLPACSRIDPDAAMRGLKGDALLEPSFHHWVHGTLATLIRWSAAPNRAMRPVNDAARAIAKAHDALVAIEFRPLPEPLFSTAQNVVPSAEIRKASKPLSAAQRRAARRRTMERREVLYDHPRSAERRQRHSLRVIRRKKRA